MSVSVTVFAAVQVVPVLQSLFRLGAAAAHRCRASASCSPLQRAVSAHGGRKARIQVALLSESALQLSSPTHPALLHPPFAGAAPQRSGVRAEAGQCRCRLRRRSMPHTSCVGITITVAGLLRALMQAENGVAETRCAQALSESAFPSRPFLVGFPSRPFRVGCQCRLGPANIAKGPPLLFDSSSKFSERKYLDWINICY